MAIKKYLVQADKVALKCKENGDELKNLPVDEIVSIEEAQAKKYVAQGKLKLVKA